MNKPGLISLKVLILAIIGHQAFISCTTDIEPPPPPLDYSSSAADTGSSSSSVAEVTGSSSSLPSSSVLCLYNVDCVFIAPEICSAIGGQIVQNCSTSDSSSSATPSSSTEPSSNSAEQKSSSSNATPSSSTEQPSSNSTEQRSSSSSSPSGSVLCLYSGGCASIASETCSAIGGQIVESCQLANSSSSSVALSSSSVAISSSSESTEVTYYCDYGLKYTCPSCSGGVGGGCFKMKDQYDECDLKYGRVTTSCSIGLVCDWGPRYYDSSHSDCGNDYCGGCYIIGSNNNITQASCEKDNGTVRSNCPESSFVSGSSSAKVSSSSVAPSSSSSAAYTVTFNAGGGTVTPSSAKVDTDGKLASLPTPTRIDYIFNGWFTSSSSGTEVTTSTIFSANTTIYARWTRDPNTIICSDITVSTNSVSMSVDACYNIIFNSSSNCGLRIANYNAGIGTIKISISGGGCNVSSYTLPDNNNTAICTPTGTTTIRGIEGSGIINIICY